MISRASVQGFRALGWVVRLSPPLLWGALASVLGPTLWIVLRKHRLRTLDNLRHQGLDPQAASRRGRKSFRSNLLIFFESLAMDRMMARRGVRVATQRSETFDRVVRDFHSGESKIVIGMSGHTGVFEFAGAELASIFAPAMTAISARLPKNPVIADYLRGLRKSFGLTLIDKEDYIRFLVKSVRGGHPRLFVFLCDQHFKDGMKVPFLGRPACTVEMPAVLAQKYKAPIVMGACLRKRTGDYQLIYDALMPTLWENLERDDAVRTILAHVNRFIEDQIERAPEQWTWGHRRWRDCCAEEKKGDD